ncbi:hypothetical protein C2E23DRAFT_888069 [Lenzites betulinus]|nr:hypothetical protein C2E23DRAFT_888069 [Lenzites betulinus]
MSRTLTATEYQTILDKSLNEREDYDSIIEQFVEALRKPEVKQQTAEDIRNLTKTIRQIRQAFEKISVSLDAFDRARFLDEHHFAIRFGLEWKQYRERFKRTLEQHYNNAITAAMFVRHYNAALLSSFDDANLEDFQYMLRAFLARLEAQEADALQAKDNFATLASDLRRFEAVIEDAIRKAGTPLEDGLVATRARLTTLQKELVEHAVFQMESMGVACVSALSIGAAGAGVVMFALSPEAMFTAVVSSRPPSANRKLTEYSTSLWPSVPSARRLIAQKRKKEGARLGSEVQKCNEEITDLMAKETLLAKYQQSLEVANTSMEGLAHRLDTISAIWQYLKSDILLLQEQMGLAVNPDMSFNKRFLKKIAATSELSVMFFSLVDRYYRENCFDDAF